MDDLSTLPDPIASRIAVRPNGCWEWAGQINHGGYGLYQGARAHRLTYETMVGPIPSNLELDHLCRVRRCVNPAHLEAVTRRVNTLRGDTLAAAKAAQTECIHGHPFTGDNVYVHPQRGTRNCRTCMNESARRRRAGSTGRTCTHDGCDRPENSRGMCQSHYMAWYRALAAD
jgi:hypothetical protein